MAHESFENEDVAKFMNENFINIKVDREERPDIDDIYQKVCQIATGQGGWPLSVFLTPDQKPFYVGTYFPVLDSYGRPGFGSICRQLSQAWKEKPKDIENSSKRFIDALTKAETIQVPSKLERILLDEAAMNLFFTGFPDLNVTLSNTTLKGNRIFTNWTATGTNTGVYGEVQAPGEFEGFDYGAYLSRYGIYSVMYRPKVNLVDSGNGNFFWSGMYYLQGKFLERINRLFPEPHASFEAGLLVGARKGIPEDLMEKFNITGLTHIIAISGYNITIIIVFMMWALGGLPRKMGFVAAVAAIVLFTLFVGASPAVVRASIMGILGLIALNYGRDNNIHLTILWTAFFMVMWRCLPSAIRPRAALGSPWLPVAMITI